MVTKKCRIVKEKNSGDKGMPKIVYRVLVNNKNKGLYSTLRLAKLACKKTI